jgi:heme oxygenase
MGLREATAELHSKAEKMEFNQRMFRGELSNGEYLHYLIQQASIFQAIEEHPDSDISPELARLTNAYDDIMELIADTSGEFHQIQSANNYATYLNGLDKKKLYPHIYLNYMALMFGGQMMKTKIPGKGRIYDFVNVTELITMIRSIQKDEWAEEVNIGFTYIIDILDELQTLSK